MCARFFNLLLWLNTRGVHEQAAGCTFYEHVRPDGAQNKTLISNTDRPAEDEITFYQVYLAFLDRIIFLRPRRMNMTKVNCPRIFLGCWANQKYFHNFCERN